MKALITIIFVAFTIAPSIGQEFDIETKSVELDNLISFIVNNYNDDSESKNITFLIQVNSEEMDGENLIMLKQGFKLISQRLDEHSNISIVAYSKFNGVALKMTSPKEIKLILHTLSDLKGSISEFYKDGISLAYKKAEENYNEELENIVVMIRVNKKSENEIVDIEKRDNKKKKSNAFLITALALLPELIELIKN